MTEQTNPTENQKFYSQWAIGLATFLGGPLAAGYLIRENFLSLEKPGQGRNALVIGIVATVIIFGGIFMLPENIIDSIPSSTIPFAYTAIIALIVERMHGDILKRHKENGNPFYSIWRAVGIGLISLLLLSAIILGYDYLSTDYESLEKYDAELAEFAANEEKALTFFDHLDNKPRKFLVNVLDNTVIPSWEKNIDIIKRSYEIKNLPPELIEQNKFLLKYSELRLESAKLFRKAIRENTDKYSDEIDQISQEIDQVLSKINTE